MATKRVRTPVVLQMEGAECGAASLAKLLAYHGRWVSLVELRRVCGISRDGSKASNLVRAARLYGLEAKGVRKEVEGLEEMEPPYIVFWNFNHFLVVEGFEKDWVHLNDPAFGRRRVTRREFGESFTGVALVMTPGPGFEKGGERPRVLPALLERLRGSSAPMLFAVVAGLLLALPGIVQASFLKIFVDSVLIGGRGHWLRPLLLGILVATSFQWALGALQLGALRRLRVRLAVGMSSRFMARTLRLPISFFGQRFPGEIASRFAANDRIAETATGKAATTAVGLATLLFYGLVLVGYDQVLALVGVGLAAVNFLVLLWMARVREEAFMRLQMDSGRTVGTAMSILAGIETIKASALESDSFRQLAGRYAKSMSAEQRLAATNESLGVLPVVLSALTTALVFLIGGHRVIHGFLSIGALVAFNQLLANFQKPIQDLVDLQMKLQDLRGDLNRLDDVLVEPADPALARGDSADGEARPKLQGRVELRNVTFGFAPTSPPLLEDLNLVVEPGERVALVGGSGSGKSTLSRIVTGLLQPQSGEVLFDDQLAWAVPRSVLTRSVAMVEQEIFLFAGTVRENLTLWDDSVPDQEIVRACRDAHIHETILSLPGGYDALLTEGATNLSGGQRQRLEIARALVGDPSILVLDEATSALDAETEGVIEQNLRRRGCTTVVVAHRLSTIRDSNEIIVLAAGKVVERGTHAQLARGGGEYERLVSSPA